MIFPYRTHPVHRFLWLHLETGYAALAIQIHATLSHSDATRIIVIDGYSCVRWPIIIAELTAHLQERGLGTMCLSTEACWQSADELDGLLCPFLTDDPVYGRLFHGHLAELWDADKVVALRERARQAATDSVRDGGVVIVYGPGAAQITSAALTIYVDLPKDAGQAVAARGEVLPLGAAQRQPFNLTYKRLYFVEWPLLNREKRRLLPTLDFYMDLTDIDMPVIVAGDQLRRALDEMADAPIRVKPWFAPGPWGGQWMKETFGLPPDQPNYAWSFELIAPENGVLLGGTEQGQPVLECAFDALLWRQTAAVLGDRVAARYGSYFPIRFDYLDTMGGTNLSCQVHPRVDYVRDEFGEPFTQDESYYIVANKPGARVFLGLRDDSNVAAFQQAALSARDGKVPFDIADYVHSRASTPGDLFLIPSGTVHCSGKDNLVLEISATPYIFTMKIYDYLRSDLSGNLRHVHLDHAFANIDPSRRASWVDEQLIQQPQVLRQGSDWQEVQIGRHDLLFYAVHRLEFATSIEDTTPAAFVVLNLVEGEACVVEVPDSPPVELRFAETLIIPAHIPSYRLQNCGSAPCKVVKAYVI